LRRYIDTQWRTDIITIPQTSDATDLPLLGDTERREIEPGAAEMPPTPREPLRIIEAIGDVWLFTMSDRVA
jgi:hypothetical protein